MARMTRVEKKKLRNKVLLISLVVVLSLSLLFLAARNLDIFNVKKISINGGNNLTPKRLEEITGIKEGMNIFRISRIKASQELLDSPYIASVKIERKLPSRIIIDVKENMESFQVRSGELMVVLDDKARILDVRKAENPEIALITGLKLEGDLGKESIDKEIYDYIKDKQSKEFIRAAGDLLLWPRFASVDLVKGATNIGLKDGRAIEFGKLSEADYKLRLLKEILAYIDKEEIIFEKILMNQGDNPIIVKGKEGG